MNFESSQNVFLAVLQKQPLNAEALAGLGRVEELSGDIINAEMLYQRALKIDPENTTALSYLGGLKLEQKNYKEAQQLFQRLAKITPEPWVKQLQLQAQYGPSLDEIKQLERFGDIKGAISKYQKLLIAAPDNAEFYSGLGALYMKMKHHQEAIELYQSGLKIDPSANQLRVDLGLAYLAKNDLVAAKDILQMAFVRDPENAEALVGLGRVAVLSGDLEDAEYLYKSALDINPTDILALSYYAEFLMEQKQYVEAQQVYEKLLTLKPKEIWVQQRLEEAKYAPILEEAYSKEKKRDFEGAENIYRKLLNENPNDIAYYIKLGQFYVRAKRFQDAIALYLQALDMKHDSSELQVALGFAYLAKNELEVSQKVFEMVLKRQPENAEALAGLGRIAALRGDAINAEILYQNALESDPNNITSLIYLAELRMNQGHYDDAQKLFKHILRIQPSAIWVKQSIEDARHGILLAEIKKKEDEKNLKEAEVLYRQLLLEAPHDVEYFIRAGQFFKRMKRYQDSIDVYKQGLKTNPTSARLYADMGFAYLAKKDYVHSRKMFLKTLKLDPQNPDGYAGLGDLAGIKKKWKEAEEYLQKALEIDPLNTAALSSLGLLRIAEKHYDEAFKIFEQLQLQFPHAEWVKEDLENARYAPALDEITQLEARGELEEALKRYQEIVAKTQDNPYYYMGIGQLYVRLRKYNEAEDAFRKGLEINPDLNELRVGLGYAYLYDKDLENARKWLVKALKEEPKDPEGLAGFGRVNALEGDYEKAEELFQEALSVEPNNLSALSFYGDLLMKEKRYTEAQDVFARLWQKTPQVWVRRAWQDAVDGPVTDLAAQFDYLEEFEMARDLYIKLLSEEPDNPERYFPLGQMYVNLKEYTRAIEVFQSGYDLDHDALYLLRAIAFTKIRLMDFNSAQCILTYLVEQDPLDAEAWAGLGRIQAFDGSECLAEYYYEQALLIDPNNITAIAFLADLKQFQQYNYSALNLYCTLMQLDPRPKWVRVGYNSLLNLTCTTLAGEGAYHEEDQWDPTAKKWSARYQVYGARGLLNYPISDNLTLWGRVADEFYVLKDLLDHLTIYSFDVQRLHIGARWICSPCFFIDARAGLSNYSRYDRGTFIALSGLIAEPTLTFTYHTAKEHAILNFSSDSDLVARDFSTDKAKLVGRYFVTGSYERQVIKRGWLGLEGDAYWYRDFVHNQSQRVLGWFQWRPPKYSDNFLFRYHCKYQHFNKNIPDYYTYKYQIVNHLQMTLEKSWRVCWADSFYTSLSYAHGWQDTRTRYTQIIVIVPTPGLPPFVMDRRQYNFLSGNIIYQRGQLQASLGWDYYRDTEKYTMWSLVGNLRWRF